jgi:hypothetical protein
MIPGLPVEYESLLQNGKFQVTPVDAAHAGQDQDSTQA